MSPRIAAPAGILPASWPRAEPLAERLLHLDPSAGALGDHHVRDLPALLRPGDVLVVNDAGTLPASFRVPDRELELRLVERLTHDAHWRALLFGAGDWRTPTERRPLPELVSVGTLLDLGPGLRSRILGVSPLETRVVELEFEQRGAELWAGIYARGRPIQYAHVRDALELWHVQNRFAARPWALEFPSAARPLTWELLLALRARGVALAHVTHAAGISSTGSDAIDRTLPGRERYRIEPACCLAIESARRRGGRIVAAGTTVVRALEACAADNDGRLVPGGGEARLLIGPGFRPKVVAGLFTGLHQRTTSHYALLGAFAPQDLLDRALDHAAQHAYLEHEFGDSWLIS